MNMKVPILLFGLILMLSLGLSPKGYAQEASLKLGQLFSSPQERAVLDQHRYRGLLPTQRNMLLQRDTHKVPSFEFNGIISTRTQHLIWVNQRLQQQPLNWNQWQFSYQADNGHLKLKKHHQAVSLKPGQKYLPHSQKISESYEP